MKNDKKLKLTTRGRYAVMAMVELSLRGEKQPVPLVEIAQSGNISLSYLEQLFAGLRKNGLVKSYRGPGGGYLLAKPANDIHIADILDSAEDCVPAKRSTKDTAQTNKQTNMLWSQIGEILYISMKHVSLEDVTKERLQDHPAMNKLFETLA
ncbi:MAG: Rrf2 family transcriptional regulator [Rhodospirillales bacterium]|nr:Rrf2 family transcriptional regulator [Rhodospirillales bacterium]MCB9996905.1 Rrf2 family transcriptional regulator [Rhodospirillales bacterium]